MHLPRAHRSGRPIALVLISVLAALALLGACTATGRGAVSSGSADADPSSVSAGEVALAAATATTSSASTSTTSTSTTTAVAAAPVAAGECVTLTYTPSTASTAQVGDLCRPAAGTDPHDTVIVLVHGGGGTGGSRDDLDAWQTYWTEQGYVTFSVDYTLADPDATSGDGVYPLPEQNVKAAVQFVRLLGPSIGTDRVVLQGHSAGARLGGIVATTPDDPSFAGPELWTGVSDHVDGFIGFYGYYDGMQFDAEAYYGAGGVEPAAADSVAHAAQTSGWTVLVHSTADQIVDVDASTTFAKALEDAGKDVQYLQMEDAAGHGFDGYEQPTLSAAGRAIAGRLGSIIDAGGTT